MTVREHAVTEQLAQFPLRQNRRIHNYVIGMLRPNIKQAGFPSDICL